MSDEIAKFESKRSIEERLSEEDLAILHRELCRSYYEHQYSRVAKLEEQSLRMTSMVLTLTTAFLSLGYTYFKSIESTIDSLLGIISLIVIAISLNTFAILFNGRTEGFTDVHKLRAKEIINKFSVEIFDLDKSMPFPPASAIWTRYRIVRAIHWVLIAISILLLPVSYFDVVSDWFISAKSL
ncbi:hypothetical protein ACQKP8_26740 [Photobacterium alginatilyticum]|uniref:hypothetical protein n=1 Tax=Photobacterium alginatilyticum TaxID=1775171 RepID=UPI004069677C